MWQRQAGPGMLHWEPRRLPHLPTGHYKFSLGTVLHRQFMTCLAHGKDPIRLIAALPSTAVLALPSLPHLPIGHYEFSLGTVLHRQFVTRHQGRGS